MRITAFAALLLVSTSSAAFAWQADATRGQVNTAAMQAQSASSFDSSEPFESGIPALPLEVMKSGDVTYINGGVSDEELAQLKETNGSYNLHLQIAAVGGEYVSDVEIRIVSGGQNLLTVADAGPYLYVALKPGNYMVEAVHDGKTQKFKVSAPAKGHVARVIRVVD